jgi:hypothetical protein
MALNISLLLDLKAYLNIFSISICRALFHSYRVNRPKSIPKIFIVGRRLSMIDWQVVKLTANAWSIFKFLIPNLGTDYLNVDFISSVGIEVNCL